MKTFCKFFSQRTGHSSDAWISASLSAILYQLVDGSMPALSLWGNPQATQWCLDDSRNIPGDS